LVWKQLRDLLRSGNPDQCGRPWSVYDAVVSHREDGERLVAIRMTLTAPGCGMGDILVDDVRTKLELIPTVAEADVELVFDPPWNRSMMSDAARLETGMF
jgi:metal-sulfur cluster biosynthetic enzyme